MCNEMILTDGKKIEAHGTNAFPKNYRQFKERLDEAVFGPKEY
jgi:hypothetical protein